MKTLRTRLAITVAACGMAACPMANASLTIFDSGVGGAPTGVNKLNFDDLGLGSGSGNASTPNGSATVITLTDAAVVQGSSANFYAAPWLSGGNGAGFGAGNTDQANGQDQTRYLTSGSNSGSHPDAKVTLDFAADQMYFGLLWGSVDAYNTLTFFNHDTQVGVLTGADVLANPTGDQGVNGTVYVNINSTLAFNKVVATSSQYAFEFDNVAYNASQIAVPEPSTVMAGMLLLFPLGVSAVRVIRRNRLA